MKTSLNPFVYRGKSLEEYNKYQWVKGCLRYKYLMGDAVPLIEYCRDKVIECDYIDPATIGVSWWLKDKNSKDVFTGDVARLKHRTALYVCKWHEGLYAFGWKCLVTDEWRCMENESEIIGNTYDNPELVEEE